MESAIPSSRSNRKRPYLEQDLEFDDDSSSKPPKQKKVRFPKGKKVKPGDEAPIAITKVLEEEDGQNPRLAAKERAKRRNLITAELFSEELNDVSTAEVTYQDNESFVEDGIQIEPFNLEKEREEGYFDEAGNFVEYVNENEVKDAWLDSVAVDPRYAGKSSKVTTNEDDTKDDVIELSSEDLGMIKKRISSLLEPGETVLQALRRLKGGSNKRKEKMSPQTQLLFDQLTEDANKLLDHGEYNVYHDKQEVFKREAETTSNGADEYDMFADDDDNAIARPSSDGSNLVSDSNSSGVGQPLTGGPTSNSETGALQDDYVYDETSGYYYSGSSGYYYDPSTGLYCYATSGQ
ncbi:conserved hypothetical protein, partial [Ricinus communis]